jgi:hypothetical protein
VEFTSDTSLSGATGYNALLTDNAASPITTTVSGIESGTTSVYALVNKDDLTKVGTPKYTVKIEAKGVTPEYTTLDVLTINVTSKSDPKDTITVGFDTSSNTYTVSDSVQTNLKTSDASYKLLIKDASGNYQLVDLTASSDQAAASAAIDEGERPTLGAKYSYWLLEYTGLNVDSNNTTASYTVTVIAKSTADTGVVLNKYAMSNAGDLAVGEDGKITFTEGNVAFDAGKVPSDFSTANSKTYKLTVLKNGTAVKENVEFTSAQTKLSSLLPALEVNGQDAGTGVEWAIALEVYGDEGALLSDYTNTTGNVVEFKVTKAESATISNTTVANEQKKITITDTNSAWDPDSDNAVTDVALIKGGTTATVVSTSDLDLTADYKISFNSADAIDTAVDYTILVFEKYDSSAYNVSVYTLARTS